MNKREFYEQLMSEYSFDKDKILENAKKGRLVKQRRLPMYLGMTAAAAAVVVAAGTVITLNITGKRGAELVEGGALASLSDTQRIEKALDEIRENMNSSEMRDVLITFTAPMSPDVVRNVLTGEANGSVKVKMLYLSDGSKASGETEVAKVFESGDGMITGAVVNCAGYLMSSLQNNSAVFAVELITDNDDIDMVTPINTGNVSVSVPVTGDNSDYSGGDISGAGGATIDITGNQEQPSESEFTSDNSSSAEPETSDSTDEENNTFGATEDTVDESETDTPVQPIPVIPTESDTTETSDTSSEGDSSSETSSPESDTSSDNSSSAPETPVVTDKFPDGVVLPGGAEKFSYITGLTDVKNAFFLNNDTFYVQTEQSVALYSFDGKTETPVAELACESPKICWISENGSKLMVTTCTEGVRNRLFFVNADYGSITELDVEGIVMNGAITGVSYNERSNVMAVCICEDDVYYICTESFDGETMDYLSDVYYNKKKRVTLLASCGNNIYFLVHGGGTTSIWRTYANDFEAVEIISLTEKPSVSTNLAGNYAVLTFSDGTYIFDAEHEKLAAAPADGTVFFGASGRYFSCGDSYYEINSGVISPADGVSVIRDIDYKKSFSEKYQTSVSEGSVKIVAGSYSSGIENEYIAFEVPAENASSSLRGTVNRAIGLQNALTLGKCKDSGIDTPQKLSDSVKAAFSSSAATQLKERCGISANSLNYNGGRLKAINVSDTVLVINSSDNKTAEGTLYIKAGSFSGRAGYYTRSVKLSVENGVWKSDTIIE